MSFLRLGSANEKRLGITHFNHISAIDQTDHGMMGFHLRNIRQGNRTIRITAQRDMVVVKFNWRTSCNCKLDRHFLTIASEMKGKTEIGQIGLERMR